MNKKTEQKTEQNKQSKINRAKSTEQNQQSKINRAKSTEQNKQSKIKIYNRLEGTLMLITNLMKSC